MKTGQAEQNRMAQTLDDLKEFEEFRNETLKSLRKDLKNNLSADAIRKKYTAILQARLISSALTTEDDAKALAIAKDVLDRVEGKAKESQEVTHRLEKLSDKELDALLQSEEAELERMATQFQKQ
jgi:ribosome-binding protein aMBF1 (putative translation factor)